MNRASAPSYDLFKTIVTLILAVILILMLLRGCATVTTSPALNGNALVTNTSESTALSPASTEAFLVPDTTETFIASPIPAVEESTVSATPSASTSTSEATEPAAATPTSAATEAPTTIPEITTPTSAPTEGQTSSCNTSAPSRLSMGQKARVVQRLNMRNEASINATIIQTNPTNTEVEIIGGPVCTPVGERAYQWWQIRLASGTEGWSAESPLNQASYFLEPIQ